MAAAGFNNHTAVYGRTGSPVKTSLAGGGCSGGGGGGSGGVGVQRVT